MTDNNEIKLEEIKDNEVKKDNEIERDSKFVYFIKVVLSGMLDQIIAIILALLSFLLFDLSLRIFGYRVALREDVFMIIYVLINILYYPIIQQVLNGKTLGKKFILR